MYYIVINNPTECKKITKNYKTVARAMKAYDKACENSDNFVDLFEKATGYEIYDKLIKTNN